MKFTIAGDVFAGTYEYDHTRITFAEAKAIEKVTGRKITELEQVGGVDDATSLQAAMWVAIKRTHPTVLFADLDDMNIGDIEQVPEEPIVPAAGDEPEAGDGEDPPVPAAAASATAPHVVVVDAVVPYPRPSDYPSTNSG